MESIHELQNIQYGEYQVSKYYSVNYHVLLCKSFAYHVT